MALKMIEDAEASGKLKQGGTVMEEPLVILEWVWLLLVE